MIEELILTYMRGRERERERERERSFRKVYTTESFVCD